MSKMKKISKLWKKKKSGQWRDGSVLIFSLLILSIMVAVSLTASKVTNINRKTSLTGIKSGGAIQGADSAAEKFISEFNGENSMQTLDAAALSDCNATSHRIESGDNEIVMYKANGTEIACDSNDPSDKIKDIAKIKSIGADSGAKRAIEVAPPCGGVEFAAGSIKPSDTGLVGYWPFSSSLNAIVGSNGNSKQRGTPSSSIVFDNSYGKQAAIINKSANLNICNNTSTTCESCSAPTALKFNHNWIEIPNIPAFQTPRGTFSFWFYADSENATNACTQKFTPFSKDANNCDSRGPIQGSYPPSSGYYDLNINGTQDSGENNTSNPSCSDSNSNDVCDCGHLSLSNKFGQGGTASLRFQNDGNGGLHYANPASDFNGLIGSWYLITITYDENAIIFYKNGVEMSRIRKTSDYDGKLEGQIGNANNIWLGKMRGDGYTSILNKPDLFKGAIRELRIYNRELEACEVKRLHEMTS